METQYTQKCSSDIEMQKTTSFLYNSANHTLLNGKFNLLVCQEFHKIKNLPSPPEFPAFVFMQKMNSCLLFSGLVVEMHQSLILLTEFRQELNSLAKQLQKYNTRKY